MGFSPPTPPTPPIPPFNHSTNLTCAVTRRLVPTNRCRLKTAEMMGLADWRIGGLACLACLACLGWVGFGWVGFGWIVLVGLAEMVG
ncbi:hypothetical protein [Neisseria meningitidis]|uniref:hypothetical protein n=1 Tax=Neisseria meningitidis TaxID=487 RepID=UPI0012AB0871|nr:hypothetical protein [Neisseria meningitidis]